MEKDEINISAIHLNLLKDMLELKNIEDLYIKYEVASEIITDLGGNYEFLKRKVKQLNKPIKETRNSILENVRTWQAKYPPLSNLIIIQEIEGYLGFIEDVIGSSIGVRENTINTIIYTYLANQLADNLYGYEYGKKGYDEPLSKIVDNTYKKFEKTIKSGIDNEYLKPLIKFFKDLTSNLIEDAETVKNLAYRVAKNRIEYELFLRYFIDKFYVYDDSTPDFYTDGGRGLFTLMLYDNLNKKIPSKDEIFKIYKKSINKKYDSFCRIAFIYNLYNSMRTTD